MDITTKDKLAKLYNSENLTITNRGDMLAQLVEAKKRYDENVQEQERKDDFRNYYALVSNLSSLEKVYAEQLYRSVAFFKFVRPKEIYEYLNIGLYDSSLKMNKRLLSAYLFTYNRIRYARTIAGVMGINHSGRTEDVIYAFAGNDIELVKRYYQESDGLPTQDDNNFIKPACSLIMTMLYKREDWKTKAIENAEFYLGLSKSKEYDKEVIHYLLALVNKDVSKASLHLNNAADQYLKMFWLFDGKNKFLKHWAGYIHGLHNMARYFLSESEFSAIGIPQSDLVWKDFIRYQKEENYALGENLFPLKDEISELKSVFEFEQLENIKLDSEQEIINEPIITDKQTTNLQKFNIIRDWYKNQYKDFDFKVIALHESKTPFFELEYLLKFDMPNDFKELYQNFDGEKGNGYGQFLGHSFMPLDTILDYSKFAVSTVKPENPYVHYESSSARILDAMVELVKQNLTSEWYKIIFNFGKGSFGGPMVYANAETTDRERQQCDVTDHDFDKLMEYAKELASYEDEHYNWDEVHLEVFKESYSVDRQYFNFEDDMGITCFPEKTIKRKYLSPKWIPFLTDNGGNYIGFDMDPDENGVVGQIIMFGRDEAKRFVLANNLSEFLDKVLDQIETDPESLKGNRHLHDVLSNKLTEKETNIEPESSEPSSNDEQGLMVVQRKNNDSVYVSKSVQSLIERGFTSDDKSIEKTDFGYSMHLEPIIGKTEEDIQNAKQAALNNELQYEEICLWDFQEKGGNKPLFVKDKIFISYSKNVYDLEGNLFKVLTDIHDERTWAFYRKDLGLVHIYCRDHIYIYDDEFNFKFRIEPFQFKKKALYTQGHHFLMNQDRMIVGHGASHGKAIVVKYDMQGNMLDELQLDRGYMFSGYSNAANIFYARHKSSGRYRIYSDDLVLIKEIETDKNLDEHELSPDGSTLAIGGAKNNEVTLIDIQTGKTSQIEVHPFGNDYRYKKNAIRYKVKSFVFSPDSKYLAIAGDKYFLRIVDLGNMNSFLIERENHEIKGMFYCGVSSVEFTKDCIISTSDDYEVLLSDYSGKEIGKLVGYIGATYLLEVTEDAKHIACSSVDGTIRLWKRKS